MRELAALGSMLLVHAEDPTVLAGAPAPTGRSYPAFVASRPVRAETTAISTVVEAAAATGCRTHLVHLSSGAGADLVKQAEASGVPLSAETCPALPHPDRRRRPRRCSPVQMLPADPWPGRPGRPVGGADRGHHQHRRVRSLAERAGPQAARVRGCGPGLGWDLLARTRSPVDVDAGPVARRRDRASVGVDVDAPARLVGLAGKGSLVVGADADLLEFDPSSTSLVDVHRLHHRNPVSPYDRVELAGSVERVWLRGEQIDTDVPSGRFLAPDAEVHTPIAHRRTGADS